MEKKTTPHKVLSHRLLYALVVFFFVLFVLVGLDIKAAIDYQESQKGSCYFYCKEAGTRYYLLDGGECRCLSNNGTVVALRYNLSELV